MSVLVWRMVCVSSLVMVGAAIWNVSTRGITIHVNSLALVSTLTTRWLLWKSPTGHIIGFLSSSAMMFDHVLSVNGSIKFYESQP